MRAVALIRRRVVLADDAFAEMSVWRIAGSERPRGHGFTYRLAYVVAGRCVLRYDNEPGKGDHRHVGGTHSRYVFSTPERLMADFEGDIARWNHENGRA